MSTANIFKRFLIIYPDKKRTIFVNIINFLFFFVLASILTIGRIYPFNYLANILFAALILLILLYLLFYGEFYLSEFVVISISLCVFFIISVCFNLIAGESFTLLFLIVFAVAINLFYSFEKKCRDIVFIFIVFSYIAFNVFFFILYANELLTFNFSNRLGGMIANQNDIATYLLTAHAIYLYFIITKIKKWWWLLFFLLLNVLEMISTGSRSGLLNMFLISIVGLYLIIGQKHKMIFFISIILLGIFSYLIINIPQFDVLKERIDDLFSAMLGDSSSDSSYTNRLNLAINGFELFLRNFLFGSGQKTLQTFTFGGHVAHNTYVEIGAAYGVLVLALYVLLFYRPLFNKSLRKKHNKILLHLLLLTFIFFHLTLSGYNYKPPYLILAIIYSFDDKAIIRIRVRKKKIMIQSGGENENYTSYSDAV